MCGLPVWEVDSLVDVSCECEDGLAAVICCEVWFPCGVALCIEFCEFVADGHE